MINLRPYQYGAIDNLILSLKNGHRRVLLQAATGAGKTIIACEMMRRAILKNKSVLFIAHRKEIINQTSGKLDAFGIHHGVIMAAHQRKNNHVVQVASIQTLTRRDKPHADLVIIDETHLACSDSFQKLIEHYSNAVIIGLTATPIRLDGRGLGQIYCDLVQVIPIADLIAQGHLVKPRAFVPFKPNLKDLKKVRGDYDIEIVARLMDRKEITADIVKHWTNCAMGRKTIVFASSVNHSKNITTEFEALGISAKHLDANTPDKQRDDILDEWREGKITVLSNCGLFIEGLDVPAASCVVLARPTKSLTIYLQAIGRVMRPAKNKTDCIILDCAGLTFEHGLVDMAREWTLDGKKKKQRDNDILPLVHTCPECFIAYSRQEHPEECPECGYIEPKEERVIKHTDTVLRELTSDLLADFKKQQYKQEIRQCKTLDDFKEMAKRHGYKTGWAYHRFNQRCEWLKANGYPVPADAAVVN